MSERDRIEGEAAAWYARLAGNPSRADRAAFARWAQEPAHAAAAAEFASLNRQLQQLGGAPELAAARDAADRLAARARRQRSWRRGAIAAAAASIAFVALVLLPPAAREERTQIAEYRDFTLEDGSRVMLDAASRVQIRFTDGERRIVLLRGRAEFTVAHDTARPFYVDAGLGTVRAVGTKFIVDRGDDDAVVILLEGRVVVGGNGERELNPGERLVLTRTGLLSKPVAIDPVAANAWRSHRLDFDDTPLPRALAEANRYSPTQIVLDGTSLAGLRISGSFVAGSNDALAQALQARFGLRVTRPAADRIVLQAADSSSR